MSDETIESRLDAMYDLLSQCYDERLAGQIMYYEQILNYEVSSDRPSPLDEGR